ncbi:hypothetical protein TgHK011_006817 [Trichoderma gracile]|nr:hypothetical protein TgHK011_006817 [Trichoderma gracile]
MQKDEGKQERGRRDIGRRQDAQVSNLGQWTPADPTGTGTGTWEVEARTGGGQVSVLQQAASAVGAATSIGAAASTAGDEPWSEAANAFQGSALAPAQRPFPLHQHAVLDAPGRERANAGGASSHNRPSAAAMRVSEFLAL